MFWIWKWWKTDWRVALHQVQTWRGGPVAGGLLMISALSFTEQSEHFYMIFMLLLSMVATTFRGSVVRLSHRSSTNWNFVSAHIWHMNVKLHPKMLNCGKCRNPILEMIIYISKKNTFPTIVSLLFSLLDA